MSRITQPMTDESMAAKVREQIAASLPAHPNGGPCTRNTLRCPDARDYGSELRACCKTHIRQIVQDTAKVLTELGIVWWADYGTLLGAVRNPRTTWADYPWLPQGDRANARPAPGIVPHDKDADFGMLDVPFHVLCRARRKLERDHGYHVLLRAGGRSMKVRLSFRNHSNADFFNWRARPDGTLARPKYIGADKFKGREFHKDNLFPLETVEWEGLRLPAPRNPVAFCEFRYGPNWMTPVRANNDGVRRGTGYFS